MANCLVEIDLATFEVVRHSGRSNGRPRKLYEGSDEGRARTVYAKEAEALRQGYVELAELRPFVARKVVEKVNAPRLRTRW